MIKTCISGKSRNDVVLLSSEVFQVSSVRFTQPPPSPSLLFPAVFLSGLSRQLFKYNPGNKKEGKTPPPASRHHCSAKTGKTLLLASQEDTQGTQTTNKQTNKSLNSTKSSSQLLQLQPIYNIIHTVDKYCSIFHCRMDFIHGMLSIEHCEIFFHPKVF